MEEIIEQRRECNKTFDLGNGRIRLEASTGPIHFKEDYDDPNEMWKDIDLKWDGNKIDKAPYILVHDGKTITVTNRKSKLVHVLELLDDTELFWNRARAKAIAKTDYGSIEVIASPYKVRFRKVVRREAGKIESKFRFEGEPLKLHCVASDEGGDLPVEHSIKGGILTEKIRPQRDLMYPVNLDPSIDEFPVTASTDDVVFKTIHNEYARDRTEVIIGHHHWNPAHPLVVGWFGNGLRFTDVNVAQGALIHSAFIRLRASRSGSAQTVRSSIRVELADDPPTYPDNLPDFLARFQTSGGPLLWDNIVAWSRGVDYDSPDITPLIQGTVERAGWVAENAISILWADLDHRSDALARRYAYSFDAV